MANQVLTTNTMKDSMGVVNIATGKVVTDAGTPIAETFTPGFIPRYIKFVNQTARTIDEWFDGMAAAESLHTVAAGPVTDELVNGITVNPDGSFTFTATTMAASSTFYWVALG